MELSVSGLLALDRLPRGRRGKAWHRGTNSRLIYSVTGTALYTPLPAPRLCPNLVASRGRPSLAGHDEDLWQRLLLGPQADSRWALRAGLGLRQFPRPYGPFLLQPAILSTQEDQGGGWQAVG